MFSDLVGNIPDIAKVAEKLQGRKLRVATMCSGTESPLLALELISRAILQLYGIEFQIEHVFSCEIEPFKQAYIERNFSPPILFRDICELGNEQATTAYGSMVDVPGNVDLLIAGTSCVDYSNLNNEKQDLDGNGESGRTFRGMMSWVAKNRPPLVILENVCSAPWERVKKRFEQNKYNASFMRVDTKNFYIPHTRTRVYLFATTSDDRSIPEQWKELIGSMSRPSSSPLEAFLLPTDDPRIHRAREDLARAGQKDVKRGRTDWGRCESRHQRARLEEALGLKRPLTAWEEGSICKLPDYAWNDWGLSQTERVLDLMDIDFLRLAAKGVDASYKTLVWNLSQNVDRTTGSVRPGICPCLTPSMIPYITNRGGPMVGLEALSLQGIPVDELLLTRESEDQLADLAGNAMTTTVVGSCMLAAMVLCIDTLPSGTRVVKNEESLNPEPIISRIGSEEQLKELPLDLATCSEMALTKVLTDAERSARHCECEGRNGTSIRNLQQCRDCRTTSCVGCGGRPEHNYETYDIERLSPGDFEKEVKTALPMQLIVEGITLPILEQLKTQTKVGIPEESWNLWKDATVRALDGTTEFRFRMLKRQELWVVTYDSPLATLELHFDAIQPEWRLFVKTPESEPVNSLLRQLLARSVARMYLDLSGTSLLQGVWQVCLPFSESFEVQISGCGEKIPAWEARVGLQNDFATASWWSKVQIGDVSADARTYLDRDISGTYTLYDKCGTAMNALHKKEPSLEETERNMLPLFFFLDPTRCGEPNQDPFVFSTSIRRHGYAEDRPIVARLETSWRPNASTEPESVMCHVDGKWVSVPEAKLRAPQNEQSTAQVAMPTDTLDVRCGPDSCNTATALLCCRVPLLHAESLWPKDGPKEIDLLHKGRATFESLAWITERVPTLTSLESWTETAMNEAEDCLDGEETRRSPCERCAPTEPDIRWVPSGNKVVGMEDPIQAGAYEQALKKRPAPFIVQLGYENDIGTLRIGLNVPSLVHRAIWRLPPTENPHEKPRLFWRLTTDYSRRDLPGLKLTSNRRDASHEQPPNFKKFPLRSEQLRSLSWMIAQEESTNATFIEEEVSEAILAPLGWRAEGRAERAVTVRGGVLADEVGYGKTAITLGLIDSSAASNVTSSNPGQSPCISGVVPLKATLIFVPAHLTKQWPTEIAKFTGNAFKVITITSLTDLNKLTIAALEKADIVVVSSSIYRSDLYWWNLATLAGAGPLPTHANGGRHFTARYKETLKALRERVQELSTLGEKGVPAVLKAMETAKRKVEEEKEKIFVQSKRKVGKQYRDVKAEVAETSSSSSPKALLKEVQETVEVVAGLEEANGGTKEGSVSVQSVKASSSKDVGAVSTVATRKRGSRMTIDSEEETEKVGTTRRPVRNATKRRKSYAIESDDDEMQEKAGDDDEYAEPADVSADEDVDNGAEEETDDEDEEDGEFAEEDEEEFAEEKKTKKNVAKSSRSASKPKKPTRAAAPPKKKAAVVAKPKKDLVIQDRDPWKLNSAAVKADWKQMRCPPLEMFHFNRVVVDEFTYLAGREHTAIIGLKSTFRWVLSGTPPVHDFAAVKSIAVFLGIHLGVDDDMEGTGESVKRRRKEQTAAEKFHSFREIHTPAWHARRHEIAQIFLDKFVRQNIAEIDEIPCEEHIKRVVLPAAERALYLELEHHLQAMEMNTKKAVKSKNKTEGDRERRLREALGDSKSAEEALLKRCSHFDLDLVPENSDGKDKKNATTNAREACELIVAERKKQLEECKEDLGKCISEAREIHQMIMKNGGFEDHTMDAFARWQRVVREEGVGDRDAAAELVMLLDEANCADNENQSPPSNRSSASAKQKKQANANSLKKGTATTKAKKSVKGKGKKEEGDSDEEEIDSNTRKNDMTVDDHKWDLRERTHVLRKLQKELVGRVRSLRYFTVVRDLQMSKLEEGHLNDILLRCPGTLCGGKEPSDEVSRLSSSTTLTPAEKVSILSCCGHTGCRECLLLHADRQECPTPGCDASVRQTSVVMAGTLGVDHGADGVGKYGAKLTAVIDLIKSLPSSESVLVFVQFPGLMQKVAEAFEDSSIKYLEVKGTAHRKSTSLQKFQEQNKTNKSERVLLLNVMDESASGANLTMANHAIFLSPLLAPSQEIYNACETQAIGRIRRYGQRNTVHVYRFLTDDTMDTQVYEQRVGR